MDASMGAGMSVGMATAVNVEDLKGCIDEWLGRLAGERQGRQQERQRAFVDGAIDTLLCIRQRFCQASAEAQGTDETGTYSRPRTKPRANRARPSDAGGVRVSR